jgi:hypothetical protein
VHHGAQIVEIGANLGGRKLGFYRRQRREQRQLSETVLTTNHTKCVSRAVGQEL